MFGTLVPCKWKNAIGMLCVLGYESVVVFPNEEQLAVMRAAGIPPPNGLGSRRKRSSELQTPDGSFRSTAPLALGLRKKRSGDPFFTFDFDYESIMKALLKSQWGGAMLKRIDPVMCQWITESLKQDGAQKSTQVEAMMTKRKHFHPNPQIGDWLHRHERQTLEAEAVLKPWMTKWIDVILLNMQNCYYHHYFTKTSDHFEFTNDHNRTAAAIKYSFFKITCFRYVGQGGHIM